MLAEGLVIGLVLGLLLKGKIKALESVKFPLWYLIVIAAIIETSANYIRLHEVSTLWVFFDANVLYIKIIIYTLILIALVGNYKAPGVIIVMIGVIMNALVIMLNAGRMPVSTKGIESIVTEEALTRLVSGVDLAHTLMTDETRLAFLGDNIHILSPYPFPKSISIGDIFMTIGVVVFIVYHMKQQECT